MTVTTNPASPFGPVAEREFDNAPDHAKPKLAQWLDSLASLSDEDFTAEAASAIHGSALVNRWRGNWDHEHCKASAAHGESERRWKAAGHSEDCTGSTLYEVGFRRAWLSQGHSPDAYQIRPCDCGVEGDN